MSKIYVSLFHGRTHADEELDDWGCNGPILGPFTQINVTYMCNVRLYDETDGEESEYEGRIVDDMFFYDGIYYGDWAIITETQALLEPQGVEAPDESKFDPATPKYVQQRAVRRLAPTAQPTNP